MELPSETLGSVGTPQGSVISPILFNMVMIGVADRLAGLPDVKHTIYADDITLWTTGGSDGHIEAVLQQAIDEIESQLQGTGLVCSPAKSELLIIPPRGRSRSDATEPNINLRTRDGIAIPHVKTLRVLGWHIDALRHNGFTIKKLDAKVATAIRLIRKVSTRHAGMKEASLLRLVQSFAVSHGPRCGVPRVEGGGASKAGRHHTQSVQGGARALYAHQYGEAFGARGAQHAR